MPTEDRATVAETALAGDKWAGLTGWSLCEKFMTDLDNDMVSGYNEDINTLLTFAGLFSAVLTAFLIESYKLLLPDSSNISNQTLNRIATTLDRISWQISNSSAMPTTVVNPQTVFEPLASSVWINSLWFLSLILSLAAALFGMLGKQ